MSKKSIYKFNEEKFRRYVKELYKIEDLLKELETKENNEINIDNIEQKREYLKYRQKLIEEKIFNIIRELSEVIVNLKIWRKEGSSYYNPDKVITGKSDLYWDIVHHTTFEIMDFIRRRKFKEDGKRKWYSVLVSIIERSGKGYLINKLQYIFHEQDSIIDDYTENDNDNNKNLPIYNFWNMYKIYGMDLFGYSQSFKTIDEILEEIENEGKSEEEIIREKSKFPINWNLLDDFEKYLMNIINYVSSIKLKIYIKTIFNYVIDMFHDLEEGKVSLKYLLYRNNNKNILNDGKVDLRVSLYTMILNYISGYRKDFKLSINSSQMITSVNLISTLFYYYLMIKKQNKDLIDNTTQYSKTKEFIRKIENSIGKGNITQEKVDRLMIMFIKNYKPSRLNINLNSTKLNKTV